MGRKQRSLLIAFAGLGFLAPLMLALVSFLALNLKWLSQDQFGLAVSVFALVVSLYVAIFSGFISWKALVFGALPRIDVSLNGQDGEKALHVVAGKPALLRFRLKNIGWWYAKPASTNTKCYVNVDPAFDLQYADYGSNLELREDEIGRGKGNSKYVLVTGIHLFSAEAGEDVQVAVNAPMEAGSYDVWITSSSDQCDHGTFRFPISVTDESGTSSET